MCICSPICTIRFSFKDCIFSTSQVLRWHSLIRLLKPYTQKKYDVAEHRSTLKIITFILTKFPRGRPGSPAGNCDFLHLFHFYTESYTQNRRDSLKQAQYFISYYVKKKV